MASRSVGLRPGPPPQGVAKFLAALAAVGLAGLAALYLGYAYQFAYYGVLGVAAVSIGYLLWQANPAWSLSIAIVLTCLAGHWKDIGLPGGYIAPDRFLVLGAIIAIALRGPWMRSRPMLPRHPAHVLLGLAVAYALASAWVSGTLFHQIPLIKLIEAYGILPFLVFFLAPAAFREERHRHVLLVCLVGLGFYLGLTALFETVGATGAVWPHYINDPNVGIHFGRARGPFTEAVTNGVALFATGTAAVIAMVTWRTRPARLFAVLVVVLCVAGVVFTLQRSVWIGSIAGILVAGIAARELRRFVIPVAIALTFGLGVAIATIPGLHDKVTVRAHDQQTVWDRENLNRAALNMVNARPLLGFGWQMFTKRSIDYFRQGDIPLTATNLEVHNLFLGYMANLGLIGFSLWAMGLLVGVGSAVIARGPPALRPWRFGLLAFAVFFLIVSNFVPPQVFPSLMLWLWAGVVWSGRLPAPAEPR